MQVWNINELLTLIAIVIIVSIIVQAIFIGFGLKIANGSNREFSATFFTALIGSMVIWIPCLGCILAWDFIKIRHDVSWRGAILAWLLGGIIQVITIAIIILLFFGTLLAAILASLSQGIIIP